MPFVKRRTLAWIIGLWLVTALALAAYAWSGWYHVGADEAHTRPVRGMLEIVRDRSIAVRAARLEVPPDLDASERITQGAGNYAAMCAGCHLAPGMGGTELSLGLYPAPPDLTRDAVDAAEAFWVIKHGIKASGMPAWGRSMEDAYIWNMVAFLQALPRMDAAQYQATVARSGGHSHGGGETQPHADVADPVQGARAMVEHRHADGTVESHPAPATAPADDGHDHEH